jgi:hypothetical protein
MEQQGAYSGVMASAVCNCFMTPIGTDMNGKVINPSLLPAGIKTRKNKTGEVFLNW